MYSSARNSYDKNYYRFIISLRVLIKKKKKTNSSLAHAQTLDSQNNIKNPTRVPHVSLYRCFAVTESIIIFVKIVDFYYVERRYLGFVIFSNHNEISVKLPLHSIALYSWSLDMKLIVISNAHAHTNNIFVKVRTDDCEIHPVNKNLPEVLPDFSPNDMFNVDETS